MTKGASPGRRARRAQADSYDVWALLDKDTSTASGTAQSNASSSSSRASTSSPLLVGDVHTAQRAAAHDTAAEEPRRGSNAHDALPSAFPGASGSAESGFVAKEEVATAFAEAPMQEAEQADIPDRRSAVSSACEKSTQTDAICYATAVGACEKGTQCERALGRLMEDEAANASEEPTIQEATRSVLDLQALDAEHSKRRSELYGFASAEEARLRGLLDQRGCDLLLKVTPCWFSSAESGCAEQEAAAQSGLGGSWSTPVVGGLARTLRHGRWEGESCA
eukprot:gb/GFBE01064597.1/.p1 GENE.gb/GFBE01064597.1/~~gb/GFBE01064597.1/.p1  ORF type:complete len:279 (+),score=40.21 gb/GFBE01064597.1/:1-837(+)